MNKHIKTPTIGEILNEEFFIPMGLSAYRVAQAINVPVSRIQDILHDRRRISVDTSLRLAKFLAYLMITSFHFKTTSTFAILRLKSLRN